MSTKLQTLRRDELPTRTVPPKNRGLLSGMFVTPDGHQAVMAALRRPAPLRKK